VVWKQRSKNREVLGTAVIKEIVPFRFCDFNSDQLYTIAINDGFPTLMSMLRFFRSRYGVGYSVMDFEIIHFDFTPLHPPLHHKIDWEAEMKWGMMAPKE